MTCSACSAVRCGASALALVVVIILAEWNSSPAADDPPHVLFVMVDDLRNDLGCYGHPLVKSPQIDRLAARGMRFDRAYCQVTFCNPSRTSLLTGLRPDATGIFDNRTHFRKLLPDVVTLPQLFRENGYTTVRMGKIFHGAEAMEDPKAWDRAVYPKATAAGRLGEGRNLTEGRVRWCRWLAAEGSDEDQSDGQIAREAVAFLKQEHEKPFFLGVGFHKPHDPFHAPKEYFVPYPFDKLQLWRDPVDRRPDLPLALGGWKQEFARFTDREGREFMRAYYACTTFMDSQLGKVLTALEEQGLANNTVIVFLSDHGYHLGERGWWNKSTLFELSCRAPLIVYAPGMKAAGRQCLQPVEFVDIYPTLVELCHLQRPHKLAGCSLVPLLSDPKAPWKEAAYTQVRRGKAMGRTVRTDRWRYTEWDEGRLGRELYDHHADPGEYHNLADDPKHADTVARMAKLLRAPVTD